MVLFSSLRSTNEITDTCPRCKARAPAPVGDMLPGPEGARQSVDASTQVWSLVDAILTLSHDQLACSPAYLWFCEQVSSGVTFSLAEAASVSADVWPRGAPMPRGVTWDQGARVWSFQNIDVLFEVLPHMCNAARHPRAKDLERCVVRIDNELLADTVVDALQAGMML